MISILIPTYNYNIIPLVEELERQALKAGVTFELICMDDGSFSSLNESNQQINTLTNCKFIENKKNVGRVATRIKLAEMAQYDWVLYLDADVLPKHSNFIEKNISQIRDKKADVIFGGFAYDPDSFKHNMSLRYYFGKMREEIPAEIRNKNPYKVTISANMLIKKEVFIRLSKIETRNMYGLDYLLGSLLKTNQCEVKHIDNEVYHYGLEDNEVYLRKTKEALTSLKKMLVEKKIQSNQISILKAFKILKTFRLGGIFNKIIHLFYPAIEKNLKGSNPNLFLFDLYRLSYLCEQ